jgi:hypothetical protein
VIGALSRLGLISAATVAYLIWGTSVLWEYRPILGEHNHAFLSRGVHVLVFALWTPAWISLCRGLFGRPWGRWHLCIPVIAAVVSECIQVFIPGHESNIQGAGASLLGVLIGFGFSALPQFRKSRRGGAIDRIRD